MNLKHYCSSYHMINDVSTDHICYLRLLLIALKGTEKPSNKVATGLLECRISLDV